MIPKPRSRKAGRNQSLCTPARRCRFQSRHSRHQNTVDISLMARFDSEVRCRSLPPPHLTQQNVTGPVDSASPVGFDVPTQDTPVGANSSMSRYAIEGGS